jgi:hypothetical protein
MDEAKETPNDEIRSWFKRERRLPKLKAITSKKAPAEKDLSREPQA